MLTPKIKTALRYCPDLPTPPAIAMQIVELARNPEVDLSVLVDLLAQDPALAGRLMRASNSCLFARRRKSESLRQAIVVIGLNATMTLALSFSLANTLRSGGQGAHALEQSWRRVLIASCAARLIGARLRRSDNEELALAALLQDIGILALRAAIPSDYLPVLEQAADHDDLVRLERERFDSDHGEAGAWLMAHWKLADKLVKVPERVHGLNVNDEEEHAEFYAIAEVAGKIADLLIGEETDRLTVQMMRAARQHPALDQDFMDAVIEDLGEKLPDMAALYDTEIISPELLTGIIQHARQVLTDRELMAAREASEYQRHIAAQNGSSYSEGAPKNTASASDQLDECLGLEFRRATNLGHPLSLAFIRLDRYSELVERQGPNDVAGVLQILRRRLAGLAGNEKLVFASAPDEFVALFPGLGRERSHVDLDQLRESIAREDFRNADEEVFRVTISIGMACHMDESQLYETAIELLGAADQALRGLTDENSANSLTMVC